MFTNGFSVYETFKIWMHIPKDLDFRHFIEFSNYLNGENDQKLESLGPIERKFHGHGANDRFVLYMYRNKQCSSF